MRGGGHFRLNRSNKAVQELRQQYLTKEEKSEQKAANEFENIDSKYVSIVISVCISLLGFSAFYFGILGWAFIPIFAIPLMASIYSILAGRRNIEAAREEQMKTHMMAKGDKRYWGRGEKDVK